MSDRPIRVAEQIRRDLAELLREVKNPEVQAATLITITHVEVSGDLGVARVLLSLVSDDPGSVIRGVGRARGFLQRELGRRMRMKKMPELRFELDDTEERAGRIEKILRKINDAEE